MSLEFPHGSAASRPLKPNMDKVCALGNIMKVETSAMQKLLIFSCVDVCNDHFKVVVINLEGQTLVCLPFSPIELF